MKDKKKATQTGRPESGAGRNKRDYCKPELIEFGKVAELTLGGGASSPDGGRSLQG